MKIQHLWAAGVLGLAVWAMGGPALAQSAHRDSATRDLAVSQRSLFSAITDYFDSGDGKINVKVYADRDVYKIGDTMNLTVEADHDAYIYVVDEGTSGKKYFLFPNKYQTNAHVKANTKISIPGKHSPWTITVNGPPGRELIAVFASSKPMRQKARREMLAQLKSASPVAAIKASDRELVRDLVITHGKVMRGQKSLQLRIVEPR